MSVRAKISSQASQKPRARPLTTTVQPLMEWLSRLGTDFHTESSTWAHALSGWHMVDVFQTLSARTPPPAPRPGTPSEGSNKHVCEHGKLVGMRDMAGTEPFKELWGGLKTDVKQLEHEDAKGRFLLVHKDEENTRISNLHHDEWNSALWNYGFHLNSDFSFSPHYL